MSIEIQPPSPPNQSPFYLPKNKQSKSPPVAFDNRSAGQKHTRSSSFGGFVSRLLPSHRQEKGYTSRSELNDDGTYDPVGLVFSLSNSKSHKGLPESESTDEMLASWTRDWPPRKNSSPSNDAWTFGALNNDQPSGVYNQLEQAGGFTDRDVVGISRRAGRLRGDGIQIVSNAADKKKLNTLRRMFATIKRARSEIRSEIKCSGSSYPQPPEILEYHETHLGAFLADKKVNKTQQMFDEKRSRREQRRGLRESGDFLGVQGANPRTGYWDISDATSSSEPSQMSDETKLKLDQQARKLAERRRKYEEARELHQRELERVQMLKDWKKIKKGEQMKMELKLRQRRHGRWKLSENGWSSVAEPELSPIQQSVASTPVGGESIALAATLHGPPLLLGLAPDDHLFPMPCAAEPAPYVNNLIKRDDYLSHRVVSSPIARQQPDQTTDASTTNSRTITIPRKPIGSPSRRRNEQSSDTIIRRDSSITPVLIKASLQHRAQRAQVSSFPDPALAIVRHDVCAAILEQQHPFLGKEALSSEVSGHRERKATAISFRSASTRELTIRRPFSQSFGVQQIISLNELPLVSPKDPIAARIPSSYQTPKGLLPTWAPLKTKMEPDRLTSSINTSTIITIGYAPLQRLPGQADRAGDLRNETPPRPPYLQHKSSQTPLRTSSHPRTREREMHSALCQTHPAGTVISSEHQLESTKQRSTRLCQMSSPGGDRTELKSTAISISMSLPGPEKQKEAAQNAALLAYQQVRNQIAIKKMESQTGSQLTPPKIRIQKIGDTRDTNAKGLHKIAPGESGGKGNPSQAQREGKPGKVPKASQASPGNAVRVAKSRSRFGASDQLAVWQPDPSAKTDAGALMKAKAKAKAVLQKPPARQKGAGGVSPAKGVPRPGRPTRSVGQVVVGMAQNAWFHVEPVFDPDSGTRKRFEGQRLTWQDVCSFAAAAVFVAGTLLATVVLARVVGIGLQFVRAVQAVYRLLS